ncbi:MAG: caspase family protein [Saprospiraceae bacterium]
MLFCFLTIGSLSLQSQCIAGNCCSGKGTYLFKDGSTYGGSFVNYFPQGYGKIKYKNGNQYEGQWVRGKKDGIGSMFFKNGNIFKGDFKNDAAHGNGKMVFKNGDQYIGQWEKNVFHGFGHYYFQNGDNYKGDFVSGSFQGHGIMSQKDGSKFDGNWVKNVRHGQGKKTLASGVTFLQTYDKNILVWEKLLSQSSSVHTVLHTPYVSDEPQTLTNCQKTYCHQQNGYYVYGDGARYEGFFLDGKGDGEGQCVYANGDTYQGAWKNNAPHGYGTLSTTDGKSYQGTWEDGQLVDQQIFNNQHEKPFANNHPSSTSQIPKIHAFIAGVATYNHTTSLKYTDDDAYRLYAFLKSPEGGALPDQQISLLIDDAATKQAMIHQLSQTAANASENDVLIVYLSGHGLDGNFVPYDFDGRKNLLQYSEVLNIIDRSKAKHKLVITDACHSGSMLANARSPMEEALSHYYDTIAQSGQGIALLTSSKREEVSLEYGGLRQGIFSHYLIRGMKGEANENNDGIITIDELFRYISREVKIYTAGSQNPSISGNYSANMPVAMVRKKV